MKYDWYVVDEFNDVWNEEPLPTFSQAYTYRNLIRPSLNRITELRITCSARQGVDHARESKAVTRAYQPGEDF